MKNKSIDPKDKVVFVTGANRGMGRAITVQLLEHGARRVYTAARDTARLRDLQEQYGERVVPVALDLSDEASIRQAAGQVGELDILINNAGVLVMGKVLSEEGLASLEDNLDVNVRGLVLLTNALLPQLRKAPRAAIVNFSSMAGLGNMPVIGTYSVSKAAVHSITQGMRAELADVPILVAGVYPGPVDTEMTRDMPMEKDSPENVARAVVEGLVNGAEDIFPDVMSRQMGQAYATAPKAVEQQFAQFA